MTEFFNPGNRSYPKFGLNPGAGTKDYVFAGGMALDLEAMHRFPEADTIANETRIALKEVSDVLAEAGLTLKDVVKTTCYLSDDSYRQEFWETYTKVFGEGPYPARTTLVVGIAADCRVEIDATAIRRKVTA